MTVFALFFGILLVATGFVALIWKLHDRSMHESLAVLRNARGNVGPAVAGFVSLIAPIVSSIVGGVAIVALGLLIGV